MSGSAEPAEKTPSRLRWKSVRWTAFDAPEAIIDRDWIERMRHECGPNYEKNPRYMVRVLGLPPLGAESCVYPMALLDRCKDLRPGVGGRHMGVDLGFGGGDPCVATLLVNGRLSAVWRWQIEGPRLDELDSANVIRTLAKGDSWRGGSDRGWDVPDRHIHIDASASGMAVWNVLRRDCNMVVDPVLFAGKVLGDWTKILGRPPKFGAPTRRQELHWIALRCLEEGLLAIPDRPEFGRVWSDFCAIRYAKIGLDVFQVERKELFVAREGRSPDESDSVLCALSRVDPALLRFRTIPRKGRRGRL